MVPYLEGETQLIVCAKHPFANIPKISENGGWRKLHTEGLHSLYSLPNRVELIKFRRLKWRRNAITRMENSVSTFEMVTGKPEGFMAKAINEDVQKGRERF